MISVKFLWKLKHDILNFFMEVFVMVFLSLINFNPACSLAVRILLILIFFVGSFMCLLLYFTSVHEQDDEENK